ncbi:MAG: choice-of-anchor L domain-containing protein, partial [Bacteroidetes bacterium]|nr:choice-of-anchor L domain-containing protein [Bacteroidota bacterium]MCL2302795.1 choice-of-anchor L domain-containing protein [Lentimicrobiaceae bacterium]
MKQIYLAFFVIALLGICSVHAQNTNDIGLQATFEENTPERRRGYDPAFVAPPRIPDTTRSRDAGNPNPNPGSIWVNRNETINGKPVTSLTPEELVRDVLLGQKDDGCTVGGMISDVTFKGYGWNAATQTWTQPHDRGLSYFSHGSAARDTIINGYTITLGLGMQSGLLLTTGGGRDAEGPNNHENTLSSQSGAPNLNDPDMNGLSPGTTLRDGALLEFNFVPLQSEISFDYIFASEEYTQYVGEINDLFGFFISEVGSGETPKNIALLPNTTTIVSINNVNWGQASSTSGPSTFSGCPTNCPGSSNPQYYVPNYHPAPYKGKYMEYNGRTVVLTAKATVIPGRAYRLKLGVANASDNWYGSGVFLRAGSLDLGAGIKNLEGNLQMNNIFESCETNILEINFLPNSESIIVNLEYSGSAAGDIRQLNGSPMPTSLTAEPGATSVSIPYKVSSPVTVNGGNIQVIATTTMGGCEQKDTITLHVYSAFTPEIETTSACLGNNGTIKVSKVMGGSSSIKMSINGTHWQHVNTIFSGLTPGDYSVMLTDSVSCDTLIYPVTIYDNPVLSNPSTVIPDICNEGTATYTAASIAPNVTFSWTRASIPGITPSTGSGTGATINETLTNTTTAPITVTYTYTLTAGGCTNDQEVTVIVNPGLTQPNPAGATIPYNTTHTLNLDTAIGGSGTITYLWEQSADGITWEPAATPNNTQNYTTPALTRSTYYRRQAIADVCGGTITSERALVTISCLVTLIPEPTVGGTASGDGTYDSGESATITATPDDCYNFKKWTTLSGDSISANNPYTFTVTQDTTLKAVFEKKIYNITVSANPPEAATTLTGEDTYICDDPVTVTATADPCYTFVEWTKDGAPVPGAGLSYTFTPSGNHALVARFTLNHYDVNLSANLPLGNILSGGGNIPCGDETTIIATPDDCYRFLRWETLSGTVVSTDSMYTFTVSKDSNLRAIFEWIIYVVDLSTEANPVGSGTTSGGGNIPCQESARITAIPDSCHTFVNWTVDGVPVPGAGAVYDFMVTGNRIFVANFERKKFNVALSVSANPTGGANTVTGNGINIDCGTTITIKATPDPCYNFVGWTKGGVPVSTNAEYSFILNGDSTLVANFEIKKYDIILSANPAVGNNTVTNGGININCGSSRTVVATEDVCYTFVNWTDQHGNIVSTSKSFEVTVNNDSTLTANFVIKRYNVSVSVNNPAGGTASGDSTNIACGDFITITAEPNECYDFINWTRGGVPVPGAGASHTFQITDHHNLQANFARKHFDITLLKIPATINNTVACPGGPINIPCGEDRTIVAIPDIFHTFLHWIDETSTVISWDPVHTVNVKYDRTLTAVFLPKTYTITATPSPEEGGSATVIGGGEDIDYNTDVTVLAIPNPFWQFSHWAQNGNAIHGTYGEPSYTFTVHGDRNLVAVFEDETYNIKVLADPDFGAGMVYGDDYNVHLDSTKCVLAA